MLSGKQKKYSQSVAFKTKLHAQPAQSIQEQQGPGKMTGEISVGIIRADCRKSSATEQQRVSDLCTPTSLAEASALEAVACFVSSSHQCLGKAAVRKYGAIRRTAQTGPMAGKITFILRGRAPPIHHGPCEIPQVTAKGSENMFRYIVNYSFLPQLRGHNLGRYMIWCSLVLACLFFNSLQKHLSLIHTPTLTETDTQRSAHSGTAGLSTDFALLLMKNNESTCVEIWNCLRWLCTKQRTGWTPCVWYAQFFIFMFRN